ncbi:DegT/DnrJ/EryC1/StrS family aminotransferase [Pontiellaceae bacterium B12227]|nr:DegT/DnrJ/EryC1/StrS family aminotransferase [Pontiellaceae bacterium B12227]
MLKKPLHVGTPNIGNRETFFKHVNDMFDKKWLTNGGDLVQNLERKLEKFLNVKHAITTCNGTRALEIAAKAMDLQGEVIMPSFTFIATAHALEWLGITPVFCDIDPESFCIDPSKIEDLITPKTSAILGVHLYGRACPTEALQRIAEKHKIKLYYDAAHAFGCSRNGNMIGNFGECEAFSFHATKFFNTFEGGAITTNDDTLANKIRLLVNYGFEDTDKVISLGTNGKMNEICAAMGLTNLEAINSVVQTNKFNHILYGELLKDVQGLELISFEEGERNNWQYLILTLTSEYPLSRDELIKELEKQNVLARRYFWPGCHRMEPYKSRKTYSQTQLYVTETISSRILILPTGSAVTANDIHQITDLLKSYSTDTLNR